MTPEEHADVPDPELHALATLLVQATDCSGFACIIAGKPVRVDPSAIQELAAGYLGMVDAIRSMSHE